VILDHALESAFLDPLELPVDFNGTAQEILTEARQKAQADAAELNQVAEQLRKLADEVSHQLLELLTMIRRDRTAAEAMSHFGHRGRVYLIAGWVPENKVTQLREAVEDATHGRISFEVNSPFIAGEDRVPTLLHNSKMLRPIESLVSTYGIPGYRELDPTLLVAITFVLMFGIMFGDLGHGLVLIVLGALLYMGRIPRLIRYAPAGVVLVGCGLASCLFGVLYGSVFGLEDVIPHLWLQPMTDMLSLLLASVVFGVVVLNIGFGLKLITAIHAKRFRSILFDQNGVAGVLLYWCLLGMVLFVATGHSIPGALVAAMVVCMVALFLNEPLTALVTTGKFQFRGGQ
jgi:V/A-type H+-transporting ATPase subunit I